MTHARLPASPPPDPDAMADRRRLADALGMPGDCGHEACRRVGRCRGPRGETSAFPGEVWPACLADGFETLYRPVARWDAMWELVDEARARVEAWEAGRAGR